MFLQVTLKEVLDHPRFDEIGEKQSSLALLKDKGAPIIEEDGVYKVHTDYEWKSSRVVNNFLFHCELKKKTDQTRALTGTLGLHESRGHGECFITPIIDLDIPDEWWECKPYTLKEEVLKQIKEKKIMVDIYFVGSNGVREHEQKS